MSIFKCYICPKRPSFNTNQALRYHSQLSINHSPWPYCKPCSRLFIYESALESHLNAYHIPSKRNRYSIDYYGQVRFLTTKTVPDATQFHCCNCDRDFPSEPSLDQHLRDKVHAKRPTALFGFFCRPCNRTFKNENALERHMSSLKHNPLIEELKCITRSECEKTFTSPSAMLHHLESGACISGINRRKLDQLIKEKDTRSIITSQAGLKGRVHSDDDDDDSSDSESDCGNEVSSSSPGASVVHVYLPTSSTKGGSMAVVLHSPGGVFTSDSAGGPSIDTEAPAPAEGERKCPMCPAGKTRTFKTAHALWQHMNSAAHAPLSYHCPLTLAVGGKGIMKSFTTLSGMTQHLESGACKGGKKTFQKAVVFVNQKLRELGFREMKLIS